ncbi:hypothetical protein DSO57_1030854 [Entomophthora muscae]|uniref:Uncharacterized protein n=1 Tax=Entomophthora muscae TaxID=34485 RepID=A0ACC2TMH5_9FUNG|nr:hypothetical protein DSO57_1030854 [Entomophthora muscae]
MTCSLGSLNVLPDLLSCHPATADSDPEYKHTYFIQKAQSEDPASNKIIQDLLSKAMPPLEYLLENNLLLFRKVVLVPNKDLQLQITIGFHDFLSAGHLGYKRTLALIKSHYWWPQMARTTKEYVASCLVCL